MSIMQRHRPYTQSSGGISSKILTTLGISASYDLDNPPGELPIIYQTNALWDTGATLSVVTRATIVELGLESVGPIDLRTASGVSEQEAYMVNFTLPSEEIVPGVRVTGCEDMDGFGAIIGMDIIGKGDFAVTNFQGNTTMSFRIPSQHRIDYVAEVSMLQTPEAPCYCGSQLTFLECHGTQFLSKNGQTA